MSVVMPEISRQEFMRQVEAVYLEHIKPLPFLLDPFDDIGSRANLLKFSIATEQQPLKDSQNGGAE